jgi:hypothetical protein
MAAKTVELTAEATDGVREFWVAIDKTDVRFVNGTGSVSNLDDGEEHMLVWWLTGDPGGKLAIVGMVGQRTVVEVKGSTIPKNRIRAAGAKPFRLK